MKTLLSILICVLTFSCRHRSNLAWNNLTPEIGKIYFYKVTWLIGGVDEGRVITYDPIIVNDIFIEDDIKYVKFSLYEEPSEFYQDSIGNYIRPTDDSIEYLFRKYDDFIQAVYNKQPSTVIF